MRKELRRSLFAAAFGAALVGCGGSAHPPSGSGTGGPPPPPPPPPPTPGSYFQAGRAGVTNPTTTIPFFNQPLNTGPFGLVYADTSNLPSAFAVTTGGMNQLEAGGLGFDVATVSEYFPSAGTATSWGIRYRVYAEAGAGNTGLLFAVDLRKTATAPPAPPVPVQLSSGTVTGLALCPTPPVLYDNFRSADQSWIVFHAKGPDMDCGTLDDQFVGIQLSMSSSTAPKALAQLEPVEALYDTNGTITGFLAINHPTLVNGFPSTAVPLQKVDANFGTATTFSPTLTGQGNNFAGGDFRSLGVSTGNVWLYVDSSSVFAVDLTTGVTTQIPGFTLRSGDVAQGRAVFDGSKAYVAFASSVSGFTGSYIVQIDTTTKTVTGTQTRDAAGLNGITLIGVTSNNAVYLINDGTAIKSLLKSNLATAPVTLWPPAATARRIDALMTAGGPSGPPLAFLVGDTVYFTVADATASGATGFAKQPFYVTFNVSGVPAAATAFGTGVGAVLGVVAPASIPTTGAFTNDGVLVLTAGANGATAGQAVFASASVASTLSLYGAAGALTRSIGSFTMTNPSTSGARASPITGVALNEPVQAGMPAMLQFFGLDGVGSPSSDIAVYATDVSILLTEVSGFGS